METYPVIYIDFPHPFKWCNGLYIVLGERDGGELVLCRLNKKGTPDLIDGKYSESITGVGNPGIVKTNLTYTGKKYTK
jgi:hypothetical protein